MYCAQCGAQNDENAHRCVSCSEVLRRADAGSPDEVGYPAHAHLAFAILATVFCCQISGIVAIVFSALAMSNNSNGQFAQAHRCARTAKTWIWVSFGIGLLIWIPYAIFIAFVSIVGSGVTP